MSKHVHNSNTEYKFWKDKLSTKYIVLIQKI